MKTEDADTHHVGFTRTHTFKVIRERERERERERVNSGYIFPHIMNVAQLRTVRILVSYGQGQALAQLLNTWLNLYKCI
jgi:hypothetical protein